MSPERAERDWRFAGYTALAVGAIRVLMLDVPPDVARYGREGALAPLVIASWAITFTEPILAIGFWRRNRWCAILLFAWCAIAAAETAISAIMVDPHAPRGGEVFSVFMILAVFVAAWRGLRAIDGLAALPTAKPGARRTTLAVVLAVVAGLMIGARVPVGGSNWGFVAKLVLGSLTAAEVYAAVLVVRGSSGPSPIDGPRRRASMPAPFKVWLITAGIITLLGTILLTVMDSESGHEHPLTFAEKLVSGPLTGAMFGGVIGVVVGGVFALMVWIADRFANRER